MLTLKHRRADVPRSSHGAESPRAARALRGTVRRAAERLAAARLALVLPLALACLQACAAPAATSPASGATVPPDINKPFLDPAVNVDDFVKAFEGESREIARRSAGIVATLELRPGMDVADIGAGTGLFMQPLAEAVGTGGTVHEVDLAPAFVEHLRRRASALALPQVQVRACTDRSVVLPDASVDVAFVCDTYHHFEHPRETLSSLKAALRPGGRLVVVDFERTEGRSRDWVLRHVRLGKDGTRAEIEAAGFRFLDEPHVEGLSENYVLRFTRP